MQEWQVVLLAWLQQVAAYTASSYGCWAAAYNYIQQLARFKSRYLTVRHLVSKRCLPSLWKAPNNLPPCTAPTAPLCVGQTQTPEPGAASRKDAEGELAAGEAEDSQEALAAEPSQQHKMQRNNRVHAWVLVLPGRREVSVAALQLTQQTPCKAASMQLWPCVICCRAQCSTAITAHSSGKAGAAAPVSRLPFRHVIYLH